LNYRRKGREPSQDLKNFDYLIISAAGGQVSVVRPGRIRHWRKLWAQRCTVDNFISLASPAL